MNLGDREIGKSEGIVRIFVVELLVDFFRIGETAFTNHRASFLDELPGFRAEGLRSLRGLVRRLYRAIGGLGNGHGNTHVHLAGIVHHHQRIPENQNLAIAELRGRLRENGHLRREHVGFHIKFLEFLLDHPDRHGPLVLVLELAKDDVFQEIIFLGDAFLLFGGLGIES